MYRVLLKSVTLCIVGAMMGVSAYATTVVRYSTWAKEGQAQLIGAEAFKKSLEALSGGAFKVEIFPGFQLGTPREVFTQLALNTTQIVASGDPGMKELEYLALPYLMKDLGRYEKVIATDFGQKWMQRLVKERQMRLLDIIPRSPRQISTNSAVNAVADLRGLNLRTPTRDYYVESMKQIGVKPTPLPFKELYTALQSGLVEGQENAIETVYGSKLYEVQSHIAMVNYIHKPGYVMISEIFWNGLNNQEKAWFQHAAKVQRDATNANIDSNAKKLIAEMEQAGVTFTYPDREEFKRALWPVTERLGKGIWGDALFEKIVDIGQAD